MKINLFSHRGFLLNSAKENSLDAFREAIKNNFKAIEFDVWFLDSKLLLKHDKPLKKEVNKLAHLSDIFSFSNKISYWIDFKNLDEKNVKIVLNLVKKEMVFRKINLSKLYFAPFITDYKLSQKILVNVKKIFGDKARFVAVCDSLEKEEELYKFISKNNIKFLSIFHKLVDERFVKKFKEVEIFAWTVNEVKDLKRLQKLRVKNFATDKILP